MYENHRNALRFEHSVILQFLSREFSHMYAYILQRNYFVWVDGENSFPEEYQYIWCVHEVHAIIHAILLSYQYSSRST